MTKKKSSEKAYEKIRDLILSLKMSPGESVTEHSLSEMLGIGRTPVREALAKLELDGLIYSDKGRKTVYLTTIDEVKEIFDIKSALEGAITGWATERGSQEDKKELAKIMDQMKVLAKKRSENEEQRQKNLEDWITTDHALHNVIFRMAGSARSQKIIENLNIQWHRTRISVYAIEGRVLRSCKEHEQVVKYIIEGEAEKAEMAMRKHLATMKVEIENVMRLFNYPQS